MAAPFDLLRPATPLAPAIALCAMIEAPTCCHKMHGTSVLPKPAVCALQYGYRMGKAALNIAGATLARDLKPRSIPVALIHPGVVRSAGGAKVWRAT